MDHETMVLSPVAAATGPTLAEAGNQQFVMEPVAPTIVAPMDRASLLVLIRQQIEFYFSDENLPKDVFLLKQIEKDKTKEGYVSLKVLAGFPKMKKLTHDLGAIREAVEGSDLVVLSSDGLSVKRKIALVLPEDTTEKRTLYVTRLPKDCDRESLMLVFSEFGTVIRLDLPMDKKTGEHKGMAFVEFQLEEQMHKALEAFTTNATKYKMVAKPFKSRNSKESQPLNPKPESQGENEKEDNAEEDGEDPSPRGKDVKRNSAGKSRNSKEMKEGDQQNIKRNSKELKEGNSPANKEKRNSKETKDSLNNESPKRNSKEMKQESPDHNKKIAVKAEERRKSKESLSPDNQNKDGNKRNSKETKQGETKRTSKDMKKEAKRTSSEIKSDGTGREVPMVPDSVYESQNSFNQARARGARTQRNSKEDWEPPSDNRPKFHLKPTAAEEKPLFVPIRNPIGPSADGRGFSSGRGKIIIK